MTTSRYYATQTPIKFEMDQEFITRAGEQLCDEIQLKVDNLVATVSPEDATFNNVVRPLLQHENETQLTMNLLTLYSLVATDQSTRSAAAKWTQKVSHVRGETTSRLELCKLIDIVHQRQKNDKVLDGESHKALKAVRRDLVRRGVGCSRETTLALLDNTQRLGTITTQFMENLDGTEHCVWLTPEELAGVPADSLASLQHGMDDFAGKLKVDLLGPEARWYLTVMSSPSTRQKLYLETRRVCEENIPLFREALQLRQKSALVLGYPNHLAYKVEVTMAKSPTTVQSLLNGLLDRVMQRLPQDIQEILTLKQGIKEEKAKQSSGDGLLWSDIPYYTRIHEEAHYCLDQELISEYFELQKTVSNMLALFGKLLGFVFKDISNTAGEPSALEQNCVWHPDVQLYTVWDDELEGVGFAGYLYLDLHPRPGKCGGAQCRPLQLGFERADGKRHYPATVLLTNFNKSTPEKPSLLRHSEVVLLFHELGHGIHDLAGRCKYSRFHGAETVMDFAEAPSQMLENWCWNATALKKLSSHYRTGNSLPDEVIDALIRTRVVLPALKLLPQLKMTLFDADVHSEAPREDGSIDVAGIYARYAELGGIQNGGDEHGYTTYRHLFSGNDAGMYSYLWSKVIAQDMFDTAFKQNPLDDKVGRRYRHLVLEKGGSQDEMDTVAGFLGRRPTSEAFQRSLGLD